jgi:hypothetical protein
MSRTEAQERFSIAGLGRQGFGGFRTVKELRGSELAEVATAPGVYAVLCPLDSAPAFLPTSAGGWFKGKDPTVWVAVLEARWIADAEVLYVGKATAGSSGRSGLRRRLGQLLDYGSGRPIGHQGGRYLWQVAGADEFLVAWYGAYPFANIAGPRA